MELQQLRYFTAAARLGNFTRAAEACHVSQPTLSQQIAKLEQDLGLPLFDRQGRTTTLTEAGELLLERAEHALHLLDEAREVLHSAKQSLKLTIAAIPTIAPYFLPTVLVNFARTHPAAHVRVREHTTEECLKYLTEGELDLVILALPVRGDHLASEALFVEELKLVLPANHRLAEKPQIRLSELAEEPFVLLHEAHCLTGQALGFCTRHSLAPIVTGQLHQLGTVLELVRLGQGISLVPEMAARQDTNPQRVYRSIRGDQPTRTIGMVWSKLKFRNPLFNDFADCLRASQSAE